MELDPHIEQRMQDRIDRSGACWLWTGNTNDKGYGYITNNGKRVRVHRVAYVLEHGLIPEGMQVDHSCRVRNCVNPIHLRLATNKQNMENIGNRQGSAVPYRGVTRIYRKKTGYKYIGGVKHNDVYYYCGSHDTAEAANLAVVSMRNLLYTHNTQDERISKTVETTYVYKDDGET